MLTQAEQAIYDSLTAKYNTPAPAFAPVQQPVPQYQPPVPQTTPVNQMDAVNRYVDQIVEQKMAAYQAKMLESVVQPSTVPAASPAASPLSNHADFIAEIQKTVMNGLTLMQTGRFFQLAVGAGNKKEELFKNAILGFLKTEGGVKSLQAFADSLIKAIDGAGEAVEKESKK